MSLDDATKTKVQEGILRAEVLLRALKGDVQDAKNAGIDVSSIETKMREERSSIMKMKAVYGNGTNLTS